MTLSRLLLPLLLLAGVQMASAEEPVLGGDADPGQTAASWASRCVSSARQDGLDCSVSQRAIAQGSGQLIGSVTVRIPSPGETPTMIVAAPLGLFIPGGISFDVDGAAVQKLELQTCDRTGCYASGAVADDVLNAMLNGKTLDVIFQNMNKQTAKLPMSLEGFSAAFQKIK